MTQTGFRNLCLCSNSVGKVNVSCLFCIGLNYKKTFSHRSVKYAIVAVNEDTQFIGLVAQTLQYLLIMNSSSFPLYSLLSKKCNPSPPPQKKKNMLTNNMA